MRHVEIGQKYCWISGDIEIVFSVIKRTDEFNGWVVEWLPDGLCPKSVKVWFSDKSMQDEDLILLEE